MALKRLKRIMAVMVALALSACVAVVVPVPLLGPESGHAADRADRR